ncbi:hypothetical protein AMECASPLE_016426 [Ameca splendens]|uniref:Uncharacterized protein n=1 Tax=Ameca splendens TaxID=208324 RepID=A0ABV0YDJ2_9TELE
MISMLYDRHGTGCTAHSKCSILQLNRLLSRPPAFSFDIQLPLFIFSGCAESQKPSQPATTHTHTHTYTYTCPYIPTAQPSWIFDIQAQSEMHYFKAACHTFL